MRCGANQSVQSHKLPWEVWSLGTWKQNLNRRAGQLAPRTLVEVLGTNRVLVEHHRGILGYGTEEILIGATFGLVAVDGKDLRLCCMSREQVFINGTIARIRLEEGT
jgi:sporulation protein YqfC